MIKLLIKRNLYSNIKYLNDYLILFYSIKNYSLVNSFCLSKNISRRGFEKLKEEEKEPFISAAKDTKLLTSI